MEYYEQKRVLITGASGFVGRKLAHALVSENAHVYSLVKSPFAETNTSAFPDTEVLTCDIADADQVEQCFERTKPDLVFNLAAAKRDNTIKGLMAQWSVTAGGAINVAHQVMHREIPLIQLGSSEEYGDGPTPFLETQPDKPISGYSAAKASATRFLLAAHEAVNLPVIIARPTVVYGPRQIGDMFIPYLVRHFIDNEEPQLTACKQTRDFLYIDDLISALLQLGRHPELAGNIFNVSSGKATKLETVVEMCAKLCRYKGPSGIGTRASRTNEVMEHCASHEKISATTGWQPEFDLQEGLRRTVSFWQENRRRAAASVNL